ncbi:MAG: DHH family phosphoesterase [Candidatus Caldarchaeales archaeon]|jgi:nanoRNase/pAp phosphatase (c-di-AMP/oligoRNAs hydrolase)|nr:DHH family phosphoesterase [Candidatus Caldarchaeales archaeon]MDT7915312.1 DHH family phosphoesterase [Candidatus Caldarchaeales archaeon]
MRDPSLAEQLAQEFRGVGGSRVALLLHIGGDPDAVASSYVLSNILGWLSASVAGVAVPSYISDNADRVASMLGVSLSTELPEADLYVAVDTGSPTQLGPFRDVDDGRLVVVDHHEASRENFRGRVYSSPAYQSTSEIILELAEHLRYPLSPKEASALLVGIYFDTVRLTVADGETLRKVGILAGYGAAARGLLNRLETPLDYSERIARIKGVSRAEFYRCGDIVLATTRVSAFKPSVARALIMVGAHIAMVADESDGYVEVTFRQTPEIADQLGINLVRDVAEPLATLLNGSGGGHASAAKLRVPGQVEDVLTRCVNHLAYLLGEHLARVSDE